jgi:hypothetical protein
MRAACARRARGPSAGDWPVSPATAKIMKLAAACALCLAIITAVALLAKRLF